jgi:hypothetical protein
VVVNVAREAHAKALDPRARERRLATRRSHAAWCKIKRYSENEARSVLARAYRVSVVSGIFHMDEANTPLRRGHA